MILDKTKMQVNLVKENVKFTYNDQNRLLLKTDVEKFDFMYERFDQDSWVNLKDNFRELSTFTASLLYSTNDIEATRKKNYLVLNVNGFFRFYFITSTKVINFSSVNQKGVIEFMLRLDVFHTYISTIKFGGNAEVSRRHVDRFVIEGNNIKRDFSKLPLQWVPDELINFKPSLLKPLIPLTVDDDIKIGLDDYRKAFSYNNMLHYAWFTGTTNDTIPLLDTKGDIPQPVIVAPLWNKEEQNITYRGVKFDKSNNLSVISALSGAKLIAIFAVKLPLFREHLTGDVDIPKRYIDFNTGLSSLGKSKIAIPFENEERGYKVEIANPIKQITDISTINLDSDRIPSNETKLFTSDYLRLALVNGSSKKRVLLNEYIGGEENIVSEYKDLISPTHRIQQLIIKSGIYNGKREGKIQIKDYEQIPSYSNPYLTFMNDHVNTYKSGLESTAVSTTANILGKALTGNIGGAIASGASGFMSWKRQKAQVDDLKNQAGQLSGDNESILSTYSNQVDLFANSDVNLALEKTELSEADFNRASNFLHKYGQTINSIEYIKDSEYFHKRNIFSFFQINDIRTAIDKSSIGNEILEEIASIFENGVRLWNKYDDINDYSKENWERVIVDAKTTKRK